MAVCESCLPTLSKLRDSVCNLRADLKERDKIIMDFSTVASTQSKLITHMRASGAGKRSMTAADNTTLPWTGSITTGSPAPALAELRWLHQGAKPKPSAPSTSCLRPPEWQCSIREDGAAAPAPVSSTPLKPRESWSVVTRGARARPSPPPPPPDLPLENRYDILSLQDFPPMGACSSSPPGPVHPAGRGSRQLRSRDPRVQPGPSSPSRPGETAGRRHQPRVTPCQQRTSRQPVEQRTPSVLVVGTSMVRHVTVHGGRTFCRSGARVKEVESSALQLCAQHSSASTLVLEAGINDLRDQQSEILKRDFRSMVDRMLVTGKRLVISGPLPPPHYGDVTTSRLRQLHLWLKGYCLGKNPIPTSLLKTFYGFFEEQILNIVNYSLQTGVFPAAFKTSVVKPLLKKSNLDPNIFNNYRPVSNLPFLSKILEKLVFNQVNDFLNSINILEKYQSGFRMNHSTETALLKILNDIRYNADSQKLTVLVLLDLSAAFDTVDHHILSNRLRNLVGLSGTVFNWFSSYLTDRYFRVSLDTCSSRTHKINCGVPQGSILGPILFNLYMLPLGDVIRRHGISFHSYADDTQLYIAMSPDDTGPIDALFNCILDIKSWMAVNFLQLNQDKTEVLVIGPEGKREKLLPKLQDFKPTQCVKNLGVIFDSELNFIPHIKNVTKIGFYHLKSIARVRPFLSQANTEVLMHAFISCPLDYCNALLSGLPKKTISNLQLLQNSAARVLTKTRGREHITPILKSLHWLPPLQWYRDTTI
ncbi:uncharacterized protein LOC143329205 [Chaetodon auriga]|uniref:uncharacterized protein LOC143329205 n=1 Tax=Chaetodon auriga TaxID=39042 RepID=UPI004032D805